MRNLGFMLLCGGHSSRMGQPKALLHIGGETLLARTARAGNAFDERLFSANDPIFPTPQGYRRVEDRYADCGPMGGLHACLSACASPALVVAPCDTPGYSAQVAAFLAERFTGDCDALILKDPTGRAHPLLGVYAKSCLPVFEDCLREGRLALMRTLSGMNTLVLDAPEALGRSLFINLNTPEDYEAFLAANR